MNLSRFLAIPIAVMGVTGIANAAEEWRLDPASSQLTFVFNQSGADNTGRFHTFSTAIRFDPQDLAHSNITVTVDTTSADTGDADRDDELKGPNTLWVSRYPAASYTTTKIVAVGAGQFRADGTLTLRGRTGDVTIVFTFKPNGAAASLQGTATLMRTNYGVGTGEYESTDTLADEVKVNFALTLKRP